METTAAGLPFDLLRVRVEMHGGWARWMLPVGQISPPSGKPDPQGA